MREAGSRLPCGVARSLSLALLVLLAAAPATAAEVERRSPRDFTQRAPVEGEMAASGAYSISLSVEAVAALDAGGEVRLFDAAGREIPSLVATAGARKDVVERPAVIFNRAWQADGTQTLSVELADRTVGPVDEFVITIDDDDYHLLVRVEGSDDGEHWGILADRLHLIRHSVTSEDIDYVHDVLRIPTARFREYRFTFVPRVPLAPGAEPLAIESVKVRQAVERGETLDVPVALEPFEDPQDRDARHQYFRLDLPQADLGVDRVTLTIPADGYARSASLWEWSDERQRRTRRLACTVVFRYGEDVHTGFQGFRTDAARLVLMVDQGDDEPIPVAAARASRPLQQVRFLAPDELQPPLALYFDPEQARPPRYDLARRLRENEVDGFLPLGLGRLEANPAFEEAPAPRSERVPYLLYLLVVPLVIVVAGYVARTIRRGLPEDPPADS